MSIFSDISEQNYYDGTSGKRELRYIYIENDISVRAQIDEANRLLSQLKEYYNNQDMEIRFTESNLSRFQGAFIVKVNAAVKEGEIEEEWIREFTLRMVFEAEDSFCVKVGLVLSENYLDEDELRRAVEVYSHSGEYIFYMARAVKRLRNYNEFLINLAKASQGTIKIFAICNVDYFSRDNVKYLLEDGYRDVYYENLLINYILMTVNIEDYLSFTEDNDKRINRLAYMVYKHLRSFDFKKSPIRELVIKRLMPEFREKGRDVYALLSMLLVGQWISSENSGDKSGSRYLSVINPLKEDKWKNIFIDSLGSEEIDSVDILEMASFYDYRLNVDELRRLFENNSLDFYLYWYINNKEGSDIRIEFMHKFLDLIDINTLISDGGGNTSIEKGIEDIIFAIIIGGCAKIYPDGKDLALKGIFGRSREVRKEAVNALKYHRDKLTSEEIEIINRAIKTEASSELKKAMSRLVYSNEDVKNEYISEAVMRKKKTQRHAKDIYLMTTYVAGFRYRDIDKIKEEIRESNIFYLIEEKDNPYDNKAVRIVSVNGYVIGYIPRKDNEILFNMLIKNVHLYCVVREYSLEEDHISAQVYFSYKNVLDEASQLFRVITSKETDITKIKMIRCV